MPPTSSHNAWMDHVPFQTPNANFLSAWRRHRGMTQEQLAEAIDTTPGVISLLESGQRKLSPKWLRKLAPVLNTTPGFILDIDPDEMPTDVLDVWSSIPEASRDQALAVLKTFARAA